METGPLCQMALGIDVLTAQDTENFRVAVGNAVTVPALSTIPFNASYSNNTYGRSGHVQPYSENNLCSPNITGSIESSRLGRYDTTVTAGFVRAKKLTYISAMYETHDEKLKSNGFTFNADLCDALYGRSNTVQPTSLKVISIVRT